MCRTIESVAFQGFWEKAHNIGHDVKTHGSVVYAEMKVVWSLASEMTYNTPFVVLTCDYENVWPDEIDSGQSSPVDLTLDLCPFIRWIRYRSVKKSNRRITRKMLVSVCCWAKTVACSLYDAILTCNVSTISSFCMKPDCEHFGRRYLRLSDSS